MKICQNCTSINKPEAEICHKCSMPGMLVEVKQTNKSKPSIKVIYDSCKNCGTNDTGKGSKCKKCNFPLPAKTEQQVTTDSSSSKTKIS